MGRLVKLGSSNRCNLSFDRRDINRANECCDAFSALRRH
jgi:hypothetical protein